MSSYIVVSPLLKGTLHRVVGLDQSTASTYHELDQIITQLKELDKPIEDVEQKADDSKSVSDVLLPLQEVLEGVDNLIDEMQMMSSNNQQSQLIPTQVSLAWSRFNPFSQESKQSAQEFQTVSQRLGFLSGRLEKIALLARRFCFDAKNENVLNRLESSSSVGRQINIGRERDVAAVIDLILKSVAERVPVVSIVGSVGVGKTTLARLIYRHRRIQHMFDLKLWVSRRLESYHNFDLIREILGKLRHLYGSIHDDRDKDPEQMRLELHNLLEKERFFIVLDGFEDINLHKSAVTHLRDMGSEEVPLL